MESILLLLTAFTFGIIHAFDVDHVTAVTTFVNKRQGDKDALLFGLKWGLGHSLSLLFIGAALLALKLTLPEGFVSSIEFIVGVALVVLGLWVIKDLFQKKIHRHAHSHDMTNHVHFHSHKSSKSHGHGHTITLVGALHGLAGTSSVLVLIPITLMISVSLAILYITIFSFGLMLAMAGYAFGLSKFFKILASRSEGIYKSARALVGVFNVILGVYFMLGVI